MMDEFSTGIKSRNELILGPLIIEMYGKYLLIAVFVAVIAAALGRDGDKKNKFQECLDKTGLTKGM